MSKNIYMLVGVPAAGKSTWIQKEYQGEAHVVSTDNLLEELALFEGITYNESFVKYSKVVEIMMWEEFDHLISGYYGPVVIDRTNMSVKSRKRFFERLRNFHKGHGYEVHAVVFPTPEAEEWDRRLNSRPGKTIPQNVLNSMAISFEMPTVAEGFKTIIVI